jgi:hypothetical protein
LIATRALATLATADPEDPAQREELERMRFVIKGKTGARQLSGAELRDLLEQLNQGRENPLAPEQLQQLEIIVDEGGETITVTGEEMAQGFRQVQDSKLFDRLLDPQFPVVPLEPTIDPRLTYMLLNILAIVVFWFGCNNASKEIVKEEAIYGRERAFNLHLLPYLGSKFLVLALISVLQVLVLMLILYGVLEALHAWLPGHQAMPADYRLNYLAQFGVLALLSATGVAAGLLLSACVTSPDRASALLPYVLIPQIILGGAVIAVRGQPLLGLAMTLSPVYWGYTAIHRNADRLPAYHPMHADSEYTVGLACAALAVQAVVLLVLTVWFLRRRDVDRA